MEIAKTLKTLMINKGVKHIEVAQKLGIEKQNFSNKLKVKNFRITDIEKIADIIGYDVKLQFIDRETGKVIEA